MTAADDTVVGHPACVDLLRVLLKQVARAVRAEIAAVELAAERDRFARELAEEKTRGFNTAQRLADALAEVRGLRAEASERGAESHDPDAGP